MSSHPLVNRRTATLRVLPLLLAAGLAPSAHAVCVSFGASAVDQLERAGLRERGPASAVIDAAIARAAASGDHLLEAQLWATVATRSIPLGDPERFRNAVAASRAALASLEPRARSSMHARRVAQRLELDTASMTVTPVEMRGAIASLGTLLDTADIADDVRACALLVRSLRYSNLGEQRAATIDAMTAYRLAEAGGFAFAHADAAIVLATAYRRAGLTGPAGGFVADAIARAPVVGPPGMLARARYVQSQVFLEARQYDAALASLAEARQVWQSLDNAFALLAVEQMACAIAAERGDWAAATRPCSLEPERLLRAGRPDIAAVHGAYRAQAALERGATIDAARELDAAIALLPNPPPYVESRLLQIRARIREAQGRWREAVADNLRSAELEAIKRDAERAHAAELLEASIVAERTLQENRLLRVESSQAAAALKQQTTIRNLWAAAAAAAAVAVAALLALLIVHRRRQRRDRHAQAIVATLAANSPDALLLVGHDGYVRVANRGLFGGASPAPGAALADTLPADARETTLAALNRATASREVQATDVTVETVDGHRVFELKCAPIVADDRVVGATLRSCDVTETRRAERTAADLVSRERVRVAGALHEGLGQELSGVAMMLTSLARQSRRGGQPDPESLEAAAATLSQSVDRTRGLARDVAPVVVARHSLRDALTALISAPPGATPVLLRYESAAKLPDAVSDELFRMARELLEASGRVGATSVGIQVTDEPGVRIRAVFDIARDAAREPDSAAQPLDVALMEHRLRSIGGSLRVESLGHGTMRVTVQAPLAGGTAGMAEAAIAAPGP